MMKFFVSFNVPAAAIQDWMTNVDAATRAEQSNQMMQSWKAWMTEHESIMLDKGLPLGKTKRVTSDGVADARNDLNWYLLIEAESHEEAANLFIGHPHFQIPSAYIDIIDASSAGMQ